MLMNTKPQETKQNSFTHYCYILLFSAFCSASLVYTNVKENKIRSLLKYTANTSVPKSEDDENKDILP